MDKIIEDAKELKAELDEIPLIVEYKRVKTLISESDEINYLKRQIALAKNSNDLVRHKKLLDEYNSHPLIVNYNALLSEVRDYLKEISEIVNKK